MPSGNDPTPAAGPPPLPSSPTASRIRSAKTLWMPRGRLMRFLRSFARGGLTWLALAYLVRMVAGGLGYRPWGNPAQIAPVLVGLGVTIRAYRILGELEPKSLDLPERSPLEERIRQKAIEYGGALGCAVAAVAIVLLLIAGFRIVAWLPHSIRADPDLGSMPVGAAMLLAMGLFIWVMSVASDEYRDAYARQHPRRFLPPDLDLVKNTQQARQALEQAEDQVQRALEQAMGQARQAIEQTVIQSQQALEQAANVADELQEELHLKQEVLDGIQRQLRETQEDVTNATSVRDDLFTRIYKVLEAPQRRARRRSFWSGLAANVIVGFVFYVLGVLTPVLMDAQSLRDLLQRWLHLG